MGLCLSSSKSKFHIQLDACMHESSFLRDVVVVVQT